MLGIRLLRSALKNRRHRRTKAGQRGISLIDLMIAVFVTALGASAAFSLITTCASANGRASDLSIAANAARQEVEILRGMKASRLANRTDADFIGSVAQLETLAQGDGELTITDYAGAPGAKQVTVKVTWRARPSNAEKSFTLTTLIADDGIGS